MRHAIGFAIATTLALGASAATAAHADQTRDDVVLQWNEIAVATIGAQPPFPSTRFMATVELAVFEGVNAITGKYEPYLGTITAPTGASTEAAAGLPPDVRALVHVTSADDPSVRVLRPERLHQPSVARALEPFSQAHQDRTVEQLVGRLLGR